MSSLGEEVRPKPIRWHALQVIGVSTCFVGFRLFDVLPAKTLQNSGTYFIPYYIGLLVVVLPVLYVQLKLGGATRRSIVSLFSRYTPILKGIGIACVLRMFIFSVYINVFVAYLALYAGSSLYKPFPWASCGNEWNSDDCSNDTSKMASGEGMPEQQYFDNYVLRLSSGISDEGSISWPLGICLLGAWALTFVIVAGGTKVFGWMVSILGSIALVIGIALMAYSREELPHNNPETDLYRPDWALLTSPDLTTAFLSLWMDGILEGVTLIYLWQGVLPSVGKYASHGSSCRRNGMWIVLFLFVCLVPHLFINLLTAFLSPLVAISGNNLQDLLQSGPRMLFVLLPAAFQRLGLSRGLAFVFYLMVGLLVANTQALFTMSAVENIGDWLKSFKKCCRNKVPRNLFLTFAYCLLGLLLGIPNITQGGYYLVQLSYIWMDRLICVIIFLSMIGFTECYAKQPFGLCHRVFMLIWFLLASLFTTAITIYKANFHLEPQPVTIKVRHGITYTYPMWAYIVGWFIAGGPIVIGLIYGIIHACALARGRGSDSCLAICTGQPDVDDDVDKKSKRRSVLSETSSMSGYTKPTQY